MPSKKKKYNARFPAGRIKKIMQTDEEVGKVAQAVPVIISRTLELFVESLLTKSMQITQARNAKTLTPSHMKQCILSENRFDFLKDLVKNIPDASAQEDNENNLLFDTGMENRDPKSSTGTTSHQPKPQTSQSSVQDQSTSRKTSTVIRYGPAVTQNTESATSSSTRRESASGSNSKRLNSRTVQSLEEEDTESDEDDEVEDIPTQTVSAAPKLSLDNVPPLIPISSSFYAQNRSDSLVIDEDYDN